MLFDQFVVVLVRTNPKSNELLVDPDRKRPVSAPDADGPIFADLLQVKRRVPGICFEQRIVLSAIARTDAGSL
jgi:hypothetical protein